ncbi:DUF4350 domain-containing protein [Microbacterium soli]|uniref:DUF4350 domain-containing protein n=1 Tax=Microbacterium soli TaxID=446075 RepID=A0ABP7MRI6_9MICO
MSTDSLAAPVSVEQPRDPSTSHGDHPTPSTAAPAAPGRWRRVAGWLLVTILLAAIALLSMRFIVSDPDLDGALNPDSPGPGGAAALAQLVRERGVDLEVTRSRTGAAAALKPGALLVLTDPFTLSDTAVNDLLDRADRAVILTGSARMLRLLRLGEDAPGHGGQVDAQCAIPEFAGVGTIDAERMFTPDPGVDGCFRAGPDAAAVLRGTTDGRTVTLVEGSRLFSNADLAEGGNAALGLALLAQQDEVVWYVPSFADSDITTDGPPDLGDLTPEWVTPAILLLLLAGCAVIWWRGRRFGPLVAEALPVTVRASETMHGRARLTAKAADAPHAGDAIRRGTVIRLAARLGLGPRASVEEIADAASDRLRVPRTSLYDLLGGPAPRSDPELIDLARRLAELESALESTVHIERKRP